ncbi:MAG: hypothetical protein IPK16_05545 [Anaerolineales bacterium]|nr:hypothetical protein [Anaerolineales bacterium]
MLIALLDNAVKFTAQAGSIGVKAVQDDANQCVHLTVWDTGVGISAEQRDAIFQPFVQGDSRLARTYAGVGLGLAYVQRMVELLRGTVVVGSELGKGSQFTISLPQN